MGPLVEIFSVSKVIFLPLILCKQDNNFNVFDQNDFLFTALNILVIFPMTVKPERHKCASGAAQFKKKKRAALFVIKNEKRSEVMER